MKVVLEHLGITLNGKYISSFDRFHNDLDSLIVLWMSNGVRYSFSGSLDNINSLYSSLHMAMDDTNETIFNRTIKSCAYGSVK